MLLMAINCLIKNNYEEGKIFHVNYKGFLNFSKKNVLCFHPKIPQLLLRTKRLL